jgi:molybdopterin-synthase adenylyltransferase
VGELSELDRTEQFITKEGQSRLRKFKVAVIGVGGIGSHVAQQLAFLRIGHLSFVDAQELKHTNRNRYVGSRHDDPIPGTRKIDIAARIVESVDKSIVITKTFDSLVSDDAFREIKSSDYVFGCLDSEGARLVLTEICSAYEKPYIDLSSDTESLDGLRYGGQVCSAWDGDGCLVCLNLLDCDEAGQELGGPQAQRNREAIYGVRPDRVDAGGPAVVSINGVIASLGVSEFLVAAAGLRKPSRVLTYRGHMGGHVSIATDPPRANCYYCKALRGTGDGADVERYIRTGVGGWLR